MYFGSIFLMSDLDILRRASEGNFFVNKHGSKYGPVRKRSRRLRKDGMLELVTRIDDGDIYVATDAGRDAVVHDEIKRLMKASPCLGEFQVG